MRQNEYELEQVRKQFTDMVWIVLASSLTLKHKDEHYGTQSILVNRHHWNNQTHHQIFYRKPEIQSEVKTDKHTLLYWTRNIEWRHACHEWNSTFRSRDQHQFISHFLLYLKEVFKSYTRLLLYICNMNMGKTYCRKIIKDNQSLEWKKIYYWHIVWISKRFTLYLFYQMQVTTAIYCWTLFRIYLTSH